MRIAFKEWAVVVDALETGQQSLILRKGGIAEGKGGFKADHSAFLLFPTLFHQQRESVNSAGQVRFDAIQPAFPSPGRVRITSWAEVVEVRRVADLDQALSLRAHHIWSDETIASRFDWGPEQVIWALLLRVMKLPAAIEIPMSAEYGGCKSWISLDRDIDAQESTPALDDESWNTELVKIGKLLGDPQ